MKIKFAILLFLCSFFAFSQKWEKRYVDAQSLAKESEKPLMLAFAGSDWCGPCIKLNKLIFQSSQFQKYAANKLILYKADFPKKRANQLPAEITNANNQLAEKFNDKGYFPLVVLLDSDENVMGTFGYQNKPVEDYISLLNSFLK